MTAHLPKLIIILGPTATGKTDLTIKLAKYFDGEIISADSRQVYKHMSISTDVPNGRWEKGRYLVRGVPHYLLDCVEPNQEFVLTHFKKMATEAIYDIVKRKKTAFMAGGTGLYISALVDNLDIPKVKPDIKLRAELDKKSVQELAKMLTQADPASARIIDLNNPRRVIRALEVALATGRSFVDQRTKSKPLFEVLQIGLKRDRAEIYQKINQRVDEQIKRGVIEEIRGLLARGYTWDLPALSSLGCRQFKDYLAGQQTMEEAVETLKRDTRRYAKRQISWFKRDKRIKWIEADDLATAKKLCQEFLL
ncbi:MAG: tRNA (adenosine(37)-N6)-dimethylallyltransferase MiaA [Candidatus Magasanikbacteria bacterium CG10_big_fil_rev_8_21_14_0_10_40_10]|uniref:tRNA dimethylallyltransferase n=1 Tax=Candidatus Magasanikbacteria bacterium CG10_big_fil_rev_8_21_14_0_10_40_10 TaxID=1974648 RepID=A0A2M6W3F8_9BACT|nr:MAG: tRNA (adenosine(37)-N6)-dimethylallyltransferase MiaA [Candidatus Magasanikbacteria bacterium CG10_big_fil_rev_8_21_14_0_10_40_10]